VLIGWVGFCFGKAREEDDERRRARADKQVRMHCFDSREKESTLSEGIEREREREGTWWTHTGGGNALAFKQPT
jgi:hypothetical protein